MLIHLCPTFINPYRNIIVTIKRLTIMAANNTYEIDTQLLAVRKPYPNKDYNVVCRKKGNKAIQGLFAHIEENVKEFSVAEVWEIQEKPTALDDKPYKQEHYHYIQFHLLDDNCNVVSQDMLMWNDKYTEIHQGWIPVNCQPKMEFATNILGNGKRAALGHIQDGYYLNGEIKQRVEQYYVPTLSAQELQNNLDNMYSDRAPNFNSDDGFNLLIAD